MTKSGKLVESHRLSCRLTVSPGIRVPLGMGRYYERELAFNLVSLSSILAYFSACVKVNWLLIASLYVWTAIITWFHHFVWDFVNYYLIWNLVNIWWDLLDTKSYQLVYPNWILENVIFSFISYFIIILHKLDTKWLLSFLLREFLITGSEWYVVVIHIKGRTFGSHKVNRDFLLINIDTNFCKLVIRTI